MGVLWEVEGQHQRFGAGIFDFHTAVVERGLSDEADLGVEFAKRHVLVIVHCEFSNSAASTIGMEQRGALGAESGLVAGLHR